MTKKQLQIIADRLARDIELTQCRNRNARVSARKRRLRLLERMGIIADDLPLCDECSL